MKKIVYLISVTIAVMLLISFVGKNINKQIKTVDVMEIKPTTEKQYVVCDGVITELDANEVSATGNKKVEKIYVSEGDEVKSGQLIMTLKKIEPTKENIKIPENIDFANAQDVYSAIQKSQESNTNSEEVENIYSPLSGFVKEISTTENSNVDSKKPLMLISKNSSNLIIELSISENQIADVKVGQQVEITGAGFKNSVYYGTVESISSIAYQKDNGSSNDTVVDVTVKIDNYGEDIKAGFTANNKIIIAEKRNSIVVPYESVRADLDGSEYVFTENNGIVEKRYVKTGIEYENGFEILSGIKTGEHIVKNPEQVSEKEKVIATIKR